MKHSFLYDCDALLIAGVLFLLMLAAIKAGYAMGLKKAKTEAEHSGILSSLLGLLALLLAFTFGMAGSRYETRKNNIVQEANDIGTALLRADIYPDSLKEKYRKDFVKYIDARIAYFESGHNDEKVSISIRQTAEISATLWNRTAQMAKNKDFLLQSNMMLPALNSMFDIASTTNAAYNSSVPESIVYLLLVFSIIISFYIGYSASLKQLLEPVFVFGFCLLTCVVIYITLDLDRPRRGIINLNDEVVLLESLKSNF